MDIQALENAKYDMAIAGYFFADGNIEEYYTESYMKEHGIGDRMWAWKGEKGEVILTYDHGNSYLRVAGYINEPGKAMVLSHGKGEESILLPILEDLYKRLNKADRTKHMTVARHGGPCLCKKTHTYIDTVEGTDGNTLDGSTAAIRTYSGESHRRGII